MPATVAFIILSSHVRGVLTRRQRSQANGRSWAGNIYFVFRPVNLVRDGEAIMQAEAIATVISYIG